MEPGVLAYVALLLAFPASIVAFALLKTPHAALAILFGSLLFLPEQVRMRIPGMELDKRSIAVICVVIGLLLTARHRFRDAKLGKPVDWLMVVIALLPIGTVLTNRETLQYGATVLPSLTYKDFVNDACEGALEFSLPFLIGRVLFRTREDAKDLLRAYVLSGLIYIPFILVELRMSPQFHNWVYGYGPSKFAQTVRGDNTYRPMVFMAHGLTLAMFMWSAVVGGWLLTKLRAPLIRGSSRVAAIVLSIVLPLLNSLGALLYGLITVPMIWFTRARSQVVFGMVLACIVLSYPLLRTEAFFPRQDLVNMAAKYASQGRAESLDFRFENEERLLKKATEKPIFGWGGWGRSRIFDEEGYDYSVTDGEWVIHLGHGGWASFLARFGLLVIPIFLAFKHLKRGDEETQTLIAGFVLLTSIRAIDLLPNSGMQIGMFFAGALTGLAYGAGQTESRRVDPKLLLAALLTLRQRRKLGAAATRR